MLLVVVAAVVVVGLWMSSFARAQLDTCVVELQQALFRPNSCKSGYFENLKSRLNAQISQLSAFEDASVARFCLQFETENQVGLSILDAQGLPLCTLNNPNAYAISHISRELNLRSRNDRYLIYQYYKSLASLSYPPMSGPDDPNLDSAGLVYIYFYLFRTTMLDPPYNAVPVIEPILAYIRAYPVAGRQNSMDLNMNHLFASITASVTLQDSPEFFTRVLKYFFPAHATPVNPSEIGGETIKFLYELLFLNVLGEEEPYQPSVRQSNYGTTRNYLLLATNGAGLVKGFGQPLPIDAVKEGTCQYGYNHFLDAGTMVRIIFSQADLLPKV